MLRADGGGHAPGNRLDTEAGPCVVPGRESEVAIRSVDWSVASGDPAVAGPGRAVVEMRRATDAEQATMRSGDATAQRDAVVGFLGKR